MKPMDVAREADAALAKIEAILAAFPAEHLRHLWGRLRETRCRHCGGRLGPDHSEPSCPSRDD